MLRSENQARLLREDQQEDQRLRLPADQRLLRASEEQSGPDEASGLLPAEDVAQAATPEDQTSFFVQVISASLAGVALIAALVLGKRFKAPLFDLFAKNHLLGEGDSVTQRATSLGFAFSSAFVVMAAGMALAIMYDSTTDNALRTESLQPSPYAWATQTESIDVHVAVQKLPGLPCADMDAVQATDVFGPASVRTASLDGTEDVCIYSWTCRSQCPLDVESTIAFSGVGALGWSSQSIAWTVTTATGDPEAQVATMVGGVTGTSTRRLEQAVQTVNVVPVVYQDARTMSPTDIAGQPEQSSGLSFSPPSLQTTMYNAPGSGPATVLPTLEPVSFTLRFVIQPQFQRIRITAKQTNLQIASGIFAIIMGVMGGFSAAFKYSEAIVNKIAKRKAGAKRKGQSEEAREPLDVFAGSNPMRTPDAPGRTATEPKVPGTIPSAADATKKATASASATQSSGGMDSAEEHGDSGHEDEHQLESGHKLKVRRWTANPVRQAMAFAALREELKGKEGAES
jgi:hypothetical protein